VNQIDVRIEKKSEVAERVLPQRTALEVVLCDNTFRQGLLAWARCRVGHPEDAEDVLSLAMERAMRRERRGPAWDPNGDTTAGLHMVKFLKGALSNLRKQREKDLGAPTEDMEPFASEDTSPGDRVARRLEANERRRLVNEMHAELVATGEDPVSVKVLVAISVGGTDSLVDIAARAGLTVEEVDASMRRMRRRGQATVSAIRQEARFP